MTVYFHTTDSADAILREGFRDAEGSYMLASTTLRGVFIADGPVGVNEGAVGEEVLQITLPNELDLGDYELVEDGKPFREWCIPAALINEQGKVVLLSAEELEAIDEAAWEVRRRRAGLL